MHYVVLQKEGFDTFIQKLSNQKKVVAPVSKGYNQYSFEEVVSGKEVVLDYIPTILPPKKYFMPQYEKIVEYKAEEGKQKMDAVVEYEEMVIFGVHTCDLAGIQCLNMIFTEKPKDLNYLIRRNKIILVGFECNNYCDDYASCKAVDNELPNGGYDLFFTDLGNYYIIHVNTIEGDNIINSCNLFKESNPDQVNELNELRAKKRNIFKNEFKTIPDHLPMIFEKSKNSKVWGNVGNKCLGCGNCTNVCPTCYCFDIEDEPDLSLTTGTRTRIWDSCQSESFAKVAGGENFRESQAERQKHRYYRKFKYPFDRFDRFFCTGCGRCSRTCMAGISLKETVNDLIKESI